MSALLILGLLSVIATGVHIEWINRQEARAQEADAERTRATRHALGREFQRFHRLRQTGS